MKILVV